MTAGLDLLGCIGLTIEMLKRAVLFKEVNKDWLVGEARCADFNYGAQAAAMAGLQDSVICPSDGIAQVFCKDRFPVKDPYQIKVSDLTWNDIVLYLLISPGIKVDAFMWWIQLIQEPIDIVFVSDACGGTSTPAIASAERNCTDWATELVDKVTKEQPNLRVHLIRALASDSGYSILSCKLRTGHKRIYELFPSKRYYFKIDTDTILFPRRLMNFVQTLDAIAMNGSETPLYFGTMVESGIPQLLCKHTTHGIGWKFDEANESICYCQGGAGYGLSQRIMREMASVPYCSSDHPSVLPEDLYTALSIYNAFNHTVAIHCGAFRSSELVSTHLFQHSISLHYIDAGWLATHGKVVRKHYQQPHGERSSS